MQRLLSSPDHPLVKRWVHLRMNRAFRSQEKGCLLTSPREIQETAARTPLRWLICSTDWEGSPSEISTEKITWVTPQLMTKITGLQAPAGLAAEVAMPDPAADLGRWVLVLDGIADPGNVGTLLRTALALGWDSAVLLPGAADPFNDKALRASKAAALRLPLRQMTQEELNRELQRLRLPLLIADLNGESPTAQPTTGCALVLGHETRGPHKGLQGSCVHIPQSRDMESLNVSIAGGILMACLKGVV